MTIILLSKTQTSTIDGQERERKDEKLQETAMELKHKQPETNTW